MWGHAVTLGDLGLSLGFLFGVFGLIELDKIERRLREIRDALSRR